MACALKARKLCFDPDFFLVFVGPNTSTGNGDLHVCQLSTLDFERAMQYVHMPFL